MGKRIISHFNDDIYNFSNIINGDLVMGNIVGGVHINGNSIRKNCTKCSSNMITKEIKVKGNYQSLINESIVDIDYYEDNEESIQLTAPDNIIDYIHVEEDTSILYVKMDNVSISTSYTNRPKIVIKHHGLKSISNGGCSDIKLHGILTLREIATQGSGEVSLQEGCIQTKDISCRLEGSGDIGLNEITANKIELSLRGSGDVNINKVTSKGVAIDIVGSGDVRVSGKSELVKFNIMGSGDIDAYDLEAKMGAANIMGSGDINCNVGQLTQSTMGSGDVNNRNHSTTVDLDNLWNSL